MASRQYYYEEPAYVIAGGSILPFLAIVVTALRLRVRVQQRQPLGVDDWLVIPALMFAIGIAVTIIYATSQHAFAYPLEIPADFEGDPLSLVTTQIILAAKTQAAFLLMLPLALGCTKTSIVFFYLRIFTTTKRSKTYGFFVASIVILVAMMIGFFIATLFQCNSHVSAMWQSAAALEKYCPNTDSYDYGFAISDFITDVAILVMPIPLIWRMNLATNRKLALTSTFIVGAGSVVASLIRMIIYTRLWLHGISENSDEILAITDSLYWGMISANVATIAASLPSLYPLVKDISFANIFESARGLLSLRSFKRGGNSALQSSEHYDQPVSAVTYWPDSISKTTVGGRPASNKSDHNALVPNVYTSNDLRAQEEAWAR